MATPQLVTVRDFTSYRYAQLGEDLNLNDILSRAERMIQNKLQQTLKQTTYVETVTLKTNTFFTRRRPIISVAQVRYRMSIYGSWFILDPVYYTINPESGYIEFMWSVAGSIVEVTYDAGYEVLPDDIKEAILMQAVMLSFQDIEVYGAGDAKQPGILYMQDQIDSYIAPYKQGATVYN